MHIADMSEYEKRAFRALSDPPASRRSFVPERVQELARQASQKVANAAASLPGAETVEAAYGKALQGLNRSTTGLGLQSVSISAAVKRHQKRIPEVQTPRDVRRLDLEDCDVLLPAKKNLHKFVALGGGAASSLAITGATVSSTVSGGATAGAVMVVVAADSLAVLSGLGRVVGEIACVYGYDPRLPEEELFALQVIGLGLAVGDGAKAAALASLSKLTQDMMRRATWTQLERHALVKVIQRAFGQLGLKLTQKKLAQVVPVVGIAVSAGLNLNLLQDAHSAAQHAYRLRFLEEKYGLDSSTDFVVAGHGDGPATESSLSVDELLYAAIEEERGTLDDVPN